MTSPGVLTNSRHIFEVGIDLLYPLFLDHKSNCFDHRSFARADPVFFLERRVHLLKRGPKKPRGVRDFV